MEVRIRRGRQWSTRFARLVRQRTVRVVAAELAARGLPVRVTCVYGWLSAGVPPCTEAVDRLLDIFRGQLSYDDLRRHRAVAVRYRLLRRGGDGGGA